MGKIVRPYESRVRTIRNLLIFFLIFFFSVFVMIRDTVEREVVWAETTRIGTDKQLIAYAGARRMEEFLLRVETDLQILAHSESVVNLDQDQARLLFETAVDRYEDTPLVSFVRVNKDGQVLLSVNRQRVQVQEGVEVSDREYFIWAKNQTSNDKVLLSDPVTAREGPVKGKKVLVVTVPVFTDGEFDGLVFTGMDLSKLVDDYVTSLVVYAGSDVMLWDEKGTVLVGLVQKDMTNENIFEVIKARYADRQEEYGRQLKEVFGGRNSWVRLDLYLPDDTRRQGWIVGFESMEFGERSWPLIVMVSEEEVLGRIEKFEDYTKFVLLLVGVGIFVVGGLSVLSMRRAQFVWFQRGVERGRKAIKVVAEGK
jgi:hypothetical protein